MWEIHTYQEIYSSELTNPSLLGVKEVSSTLSKVDPCFLSNTISQHHNQVVETSCHWRIIICRRTHCWPAANPNRKYQMPPQNEVKAIN